MSELINDEAVYRTAQATPDLLIISQVNIYFVKKDISQLSPASTQAKAGAASGSKLAWPYGHMAWGSFYVCTCITFLQSFLAGFGAFTNLMRLFDMDLL